MAASQGKQQNFLSKHSKKESCMYSE